MKLSKRLRTVAEQISGVETVADIGCDHGFTSIYLICTGRASRAIAMDIGEEPLLRAKEHIIQYQMQEQIELRQSDGLKGLKQGEVDAVVISGLGGRLMCRILMEGKEKLSGIKELVLSPQSDIDMVRRLLHEMGFRIRQERMVFDAKKYYVVLLAVPGIEKYNTNAEYLYGRYLIEHRDLVFAEYLKKEYGKAGEVIKRLEKSQLSTKGNMRLNDLREKQEQIMQILHRMG